MIITIDGPTASGKSSASKELAKRYSNKGEDDAKVRC